MPAIIDNMTFGGRKLTGFATTGEYFAGQTYNQTTALWGKKRGAGATVGTDATEGLDLGPIHGNYKDWYHLRVLCTDQFSETAAAGTVTLKLYTSKDEDTELEEILALTMKVSTLNKHRNTPVEISLPSDIARFVVLGAKISATAGEDETGSIMATIEPKAW